MGNGRWGGDLVRLRKIRKNFPIEDKWVWILDKAKKGKKPIYERKRLFDIDNRKLRDLLVCER
jgi:hypothetical protein